MSVITIEIKQGGILTEYAIIENVGSESRLDQEKHLERNSYCYSWYSNMNTDNPSVICENIKISKDADLSQVVYDVFNNRHGNQP